MSPTITFLVGTEHKAGEIVTALARHDILATVTAASDKWEVSVEAPPGQDDAVEGIVGRFDEEALRLG